MTYLANFFFNAFDSRPDDDSITDSAHAQKNPGLLGGPRSTEKNLLRLLGLRLAGFHCFVMVGRFCRHVHPVMSCAAMRPAAHRRTLFRPRTSPDRLLARRRTRRGQTSNRPFSPVAYKS